MRFLSSYFRAFILLPMTIILIMSAGIVLSGCEDDNEKEQSEKGMLLLKEKKYAEAESLLKESIARQEARLNDIQAEENSAQGAALDGVKRREKDLGKLLAVTYHNLAMALYESGHYAEAEGAFEKAIRTYRQYFGKQQEFIIGSLNLLAASYYKQGKYVDAERFYLEELELEKALLKPDSLAIAVTANNLAAINQKLGDDEEAEKYFQWALNLCQKCKPTPREKEQLADIMNNLAVFYERSSEYEDARDILDKALELENSMPKNYFSANKIRSLMVLASIEKQTELDSDSSEDHYLEALKLLEKAPGGRPDLACEVLEKYADLLMSERKFEEAEPIFKRSIQACIEAHAADHPSVAERMSEYSLLLRRMERYKEAESQLQQALAIQEKTIGIDTIAYLTTVHRLAAVLSDEKRCAEADKLYQQVLPKLKERMGPLHPFVADTMDNWAGYVEKCRGKDDADDLRASAKVIRRKIAHSLSPVYEPELK